MTGRERAARTTSPVHGPVPRAQVDAAATLDAYDYTDEDLQPWAKHLGKHATSAYAFFNNDVGGHAVKNAAQLEALVGLPVPDKPV